VSSESPRLLPRKAVFVSLEASSEKAGAPLGAGVVVRVGDRTSVFDPRVTAHMRIMAERLQERFGPKGLAYQRKLMDGGTCEATVLSAYGYRAGALCIPLRNYHNHGPDGSVATEAIHLDDYLGLVRLIAAVSLDTAPLFGRWREPVRERLDRRNRATKERLADEAWKR